MSNGAKSVITRRKFIQGAAGVAAAAGLSDISRLTSFAAPIAPRPTTLVYWRHDHPPANAFYRQLFTEYKKVAPHVDFQMVTTPLPDFFAKLPLALGAGEPIDIFGMFENFLPPYHKRGQLDRVNYAALGYRNAAEMEADFLPGTLAPLKYDGEIYGVVQEYNAFSLVLNTAHFRQHGLDPHKDAPKTWGELYEVGKKLVIHEGGRMTRAGFDAQFRATPTMNLVLTLGLINQYGGDLLTPDLRESAITSEASMRGFEHWFDIFHTHRLTEPTFGVKTGSLPNEDFAQGNSSMHPLASWGVATLRGRPVERLFKVVPWPQGLQSKVTPSWMWGLFVNARSRQKEEAWKFINWAFSGANLENWLSNVGYIIPRKGWFATPAARKFPYLNVFVSDLSITKARARIEHWAEIVRVVNRANDQIVLDRAPIRRALAAAHDDINRILRG